MAIHTITRLYVIRTLLVFVIAGYCCFMSVAFADQFPPPSEPQIQYGGHLAWHTNEPYWFNQYVGVVVEQRKFLSLNTLQNGLTSTNVVIGTQLFERLMVSGNAGYLSWPANHTSNSQQLAEPPLYWGLSTRWRLNRRIDLKAQWQQNQSGQKEHLLLMGIDVKLSF